MKEGLIQQEIAALQRLGEKPAYSFNCDNGCGTVTNRVELVMDRLPDGQIIAVRQKVCEPCAIRRFEGGEQNGA